VGLCPLRIECLSSTAADLVRTQKLAQTVQPVVATRPFARPASRAIDAQLFLETSLGLDPEYHAQPVCPVRHLHIYPHGLARRGHDPTVPLENGCGPDHRIDRGLRGLPDHHSTEVEGDPAAVHDPNHLGHLDLEHYRDQSLDPGTWMLRTAGRRMKSPLKGARLVILAWHVPHQHRVARPADLESLDPVATGLFLAEATVFVPGIRLDLGRLGHGARVPSLSPARVPAPGLVLCCVRFENAVAYLEDLAVRDLGWDLCYLPAPIVPGPHREQAACSHGNRYLGLRLLDHRHYGVH
jgi:hypothetical protein